VALRRLGSRPRPSATVAFHPVAAAVVVAKADLIRFEDRLVSDWLALGSAEEEVELRTVERGERGRVRLPDPARSGAVVASGPGVLPQHPALRVRHQ